MPELGTSPTTAPAYEMSGWIGFMAPAMPNELRARLRRNAENSPDPTSGALRSAWTPQATRRRIRQFLKRQNDRYASIVKQAA